MRRRDFIQFLGVGLIAAPCEVAAQTSSKVYRLAMVSGSTPFTEKSQLGSVFIGSLAEHGYVLHKNLTFEAHGMLGEINKVPQLMQELTARKVDVIVATGYPVALAAKATGIPIVIAYGAGDPIATGLVDSLARPGGNVTGISDVATLLSTKRLGLLKEMVPNLHRVAMLWNKDDLAMTLRYEASAQAATAIGITVQALGVREPNDLEDAFSAMNRELPDAILMVSDSLTGLNRKRIFDFAATWRLPAIYEYDPLVRDGGLMSYGPDLSECFERAAALTARIFKGEKPADLPFEQPTRYRFVLNLKTAKAIGLDIPNTLLALADEVIE